MESVVRSRWQAAILDTLRREKRARIVGLAEQLGVSDETVRRHLRDLVAQGLVRREHGFAVWTGPSEEPPFDQRMRLHAEAKRAIARLALELVEDGRTVMIDTGSTTAYVAEALAARRELTVITNGIEIARSLVGRNGHRVYLAGGELKAELAAAVGLEALSFIGQFRADVAILSIGAVDIDHGLMNFALDEARIARAMMERAAKTVLAADRSKFGRRAVVRVGGLEEIDVLLTDRAPPEAFAKALATAGVEVRTGELHAAG